ncbi:alpha/beta hydrolase [Flavobacterium sp. J372]|uniref:alpha/beta hydrolase n=1 Tax=Flavobacterium sp. J372 TaxID=2898436 RepID=UPI0027E32083|nr:alpha/beta hydrolase [Flavobacterium sp. J372]
MICKLFFITILLLLSCICTGQSALDTSYTIHSTYTKEIRKFPFITIAKREKDKSITVNKNVVYKRIGNRALHFDAFFSNGGPTYPAVILIHGGGWKSGSKEQMNLLAQEIAARGYSCFCVQYRLSGEAVYPAAIQDVQAAIRFIKTNAAMFGADPGKVAVLGCSSGGQMAALIGTANAGHKSGDYNYPNHNVIDAIINMDGILAFHHPESKEGKVASQWLGGTYEEKPEVWEEASALTYAGDKTPPILFINTDMPRFHAGRDDMIAVLNKYNIYSDVKTIKSSPHSFWFFDPWFDQIVEWSVQFLDKVLKGK